MAVRVQLRKEPGSVAVGGKELDDGFEVEGSALGATVLEEYLALGGGDQLHVFNSGLGGPQRSVHPADGPRRGPPGVERSSSMPGSGRSEKAAPVTAALRWRGRCVLRVSCGVVASRAIRGSHGLPERPCARHFERMIDQSFHLAHKPYGVRQSRMVVECSFIPPARVNVEEPRIADRAEGLNAEAALLLARWTNNLAQHRRHRGFTIFFGMEAGENRQFHNHTVLTGVASLVTGYEPRSNIILVATPR